MSALSCDEPGRSSRGGFSWRQGPGTVPCDIGRSLWKNRLAGACLLGEKEAASGYAPFAAINALPQKAKESDETRDKIIRLASATIDDSSQNMFKRWQCCYVLSSIGDKRGMPAIKRALKDANETVRGVAACALGAFDHTDARAALEEAAKSEGSPSVRESIQRALKGEFRPKNK